MEKNGGIQDFILVLKRNVHDRINSQKKVLHSWLWTTLFKTLSCTKRLFFSLFRFDMSPWILSHLFRFSSPSLCAQRFCIRLPPSSDIKSFLPLSLSDFFPWYFISESVAVTKIWKFLFTPCIYFWSWSYISRSQVG